MLLRSGGGAATPRRVANSRASSMYGRIATGGTGATVWRGLQEAACGASGRAGLM